MMNRRQEQRQPGEHLVGRDLLQAERVAGQAEHDQDLGEAGAGEQDRRAAARAASAPG